MKVIDLLNKIANGEGVPRVQYGDVEAYIGADGYLKDNYGDNVEWWIDKNWLNTELEIIEEDKKIEKLYIRDRANDILIGKNEKITYATDSLVSKELALKINEIIDKLNEMEKE